jgi:hypothetical protein
MFSNATGTPLPMGLGSGYPCPNGYIVAICGTAPFDCESLPDVLAHIEFEPPSVGGDAFPTSGDLTA